MKFKFEFFCRRFRISNKNFKFFFKFYRIVRLFLLGYLNQNEIVFICPIDFKHYIMHHITLVKFENLRNWLNKRNQINNFVFLIKQKFAWYWILLWKLMDHTHINLNFIPSHFKWDSTKVFKKLKDYIILFYEHPLRTIESLDRMCIVLCFSNEFLRHIAYICIPLKEIQFPEHFHP